MASWENTKKWLNSFFRKKIYANQFIQSVYLVFVVLYLSINVILIVYSCQDPPFFEWLGKPFMAGLVVGGLFVVIAIYYFYKHFLLPYSHEQASSNKDNRKPDQGESSTHSVNSPNSEPSSVKPRTTGIYALMLAWVFPPLILQLFVIIGFLITIHRPPLIDTIYCNPYKYGQIYKNIENNNQIEIKLIKPGENGKRDIWPGKRALLEDAEQYLNPMRFREELQEAKKGLRPMVALGDEQRKLLRKAKHALTEITIYKIPFFIAMAFSFLGVLVYSLQDAAHRLHTADLYPRTYVSYLIRFVFSLSIAITIAYFMMNDWWTNAAPILFFLIGFFPQRALQFVEEKAMEILKLRKEKRQEIPLGQLQGMTEYKIYRFREIGVGDVQNVANINIKYLRDNLSYNERLLCDLISQALLIIHANRHIQNLRDFGIRDIFSFMSIVSKNNYKEIANTINIPNAILRGLLDLVKKPPMKDRIDELQEYMAEAAKNETQ